MIDNLSIGISATGEMAFVAIILYLPVSDKNEMIVKFSISVSRIEFSRGVSRIHKLTYSVCIYYLMLLTFDNDISVYKTTC